MKFLKSMWYLFQSGKRDQADIEYYTSLSMIFGVEHYAKELDKIAAER